MTAASRAPATKALVHPRRDGDMLRQTDGVIRPSPSIEGGSLRQPALAQYRPGWCGRR
jgi:hypothetical protein